LYNSRRVNAKCQWTSIVLWFHQLVLFTKPLNHNGTTVPPLPERR
jgi:hypothetical protein